nr:PREDICTED: FAST kinase domain-containing protein 5, mitochondrial [Bemisia tabaci]
MASRLLLQIHHSLAPRYCFHGLPSKTANSISGYFSPILTSCPLQKFLPRMCFSTNSEAQPETPIRTSLESVELENTFAVKVLQNGCFGIKHAMDAFPKLRDNTTMLNPSEVQKMDWSDSIPKLLEQFQYISEQRKPQEYCLLSHELFTPMTEALIKRFPNMADEEILQILRNLAMWPHDHTRSGNYSHLTKALDQECVMRVRSWKTSQILLAALHWYLIGRAKSSDCVYLGLKKVGRKTHRLTKSQFVQLMFFLNASRCHHPSVNMMEAEWKMYKEIDQFTIHELGIICLGFFKSQTTIKEPKLVEAIIDRLAENIDIVHDFTVTAILKCIRHSLKFTHHDYLVENLIPVLAERSDKYPFVVCVHIASLLNKNHIQNDKILKTLAQKLKENMKTARIKELTAVAGCLSGLNYKCEEIPNIYELTVNEFQSPDRQDEIMEHPRQLSIFLNKMQVEELYPEDLLSKAFSHEFLVHCFGKRFNRFSVPVHYLQLSEGVKLEAPSYQGPLLSPELEESMKDKAAWYVPNENSRIKADKLIYSMYCQLSDLLGGQEYAKIMSILPSFMKPDIIYCLEEETGRPLPIPEELRPDAYLKTTLPSAGGKWHCIYGTGEFGHCYKTGEPVGYMRLRERLLTKLGIEPHFCFLPFIKMLPLSEEERLDVIKQIINYSKYEQIWRTNR